MRAVCGELQPIATRNRRNTLRFSLDGDVDDAGAFALHALHTPGQLLRLRHKARPVAGALALDAGRGSSCQSSISR